MIEKSRWRFPEKKFDVVFFKMRIFVEREFLASLAFLAFLAFAVKSVIQGRKFISDTAAAWLLSQGNFL